jgi:hypothetical protein
MHAPTIFTLRSGIAQGRMVYLGVGGEIDRKVNPMLIVHEGETVQINLINGEGAEHDIVRPSRGRDGRSHPSGAWVDRPGRYVLVDHALSRIERGLAGFVIVDGPADHDLMHSGPAKR